jgi:hypothetical protein
MIRFLVFFISIAPSIAALKEFVFMVNEVHVHGLRPIRIMVHDSIIMSMMQIV